MRAQIVSRRAVLVVGYWKDEGKGEIAPVAEIPGPFYAASVGELLEVANRIYLAGYYISYFAVDDMEVKELNRRLADRAEAERYLRSVS